MVFENGNQLSNQLMLWFQNFPEKQELHDKFRQEIQKFLKIDWHSNWKENALPLFSKEM